MAQYQGGKTFTLKRYGLGAELTRWYNAIRPGRIFDLTCGSGAVIEHFAHVLGDRPGPALIASDAQPAAVGLLAGLRRGWEPPATFTREQWYELRPSSTLPDPTCAGCDQGRDCHTCAPYTDPLIGFAGFGVSFGGKYFSGYGGYSRPKYSDPVGSVARVYRRQAGPLARVDALHCAHYANAYGVHTAATLYSAIAGSTPDLVYLDIPYKGTAGYAGVEKFDHARFWQWASAVSEYGVPVLVSEFTAPEPWQRVWYCDRVIETGTGRHGPAKARAEDGLWAHPATIAAYQPALQGVAPLI